MPAILDIRGRQIFDSRGNPTVEVDVVLEDGSMGRAAVPSGASTGSYEALELRDQESAYGGKSVGKAVDHVNGEIFELLCGMEALDQLDIDAHLNTLDGTSTKSRLGANGILGVSLAVAQAAASSRDLSLFRYLGGPMASLLPTPLMNIINGGAHADNRLDVQEFMIVPLGATSFSHAMQMGTEIFHQLKQNLKRQGMNTNVGDEGGFAPMMDRTEEALDALMAAITQAGYTPEVDVALALDVAATELYDKGAYHFKGSQNKFDSEQMVAFYQRLIKTYPIVSIEDGMAEDDWDGWQLLMNELGSQVQIVGDDLFVTNVNRLKRGIEWGAANAILIKPNQIGTLSETVETIQHAQKNAMNTIISHRSGETEDCIISDLAVAYSMGQIKTGSLSRSDRMAKYNQLLRIEEELGATATYSGATPFTHFVRV